MSSKYFEDLNVGDEFVSAARTITEADIVLFVGQSGVTEPLFTDEEYAKKTIFGGRIVPGSLTHVIAFGLGIRLGLTDTTSIALLAMDKFRWAAPVRPGDTIHTEIKVLEKKETSKPDRGVIIYKHIVKNQKGEIVHEFERTQLLRRKPKD